MSNLEEQLGAEAQERMIAAKNNRKPFSPDHHDTSLLLRIRILRSVSLTNGSDPTAFFSDFKDTKKILKLMDSNVMLNFLLTMQLSQAFYFFMANPRDVNEKEG